MGPREGSTVAGGVTLPSGERGGGGGPPGYQRWRRPPIRRIQREGSRRRPSVPTSLRLRQRFGCDGVTLPFDLVTWCLEVVRMNCGILSSSLEKVIKPNLVALQQCGLTIANWPSYVFMSRSISRPTKHLEEAIALAKEFGLKPGTRIFAIAVVEFAILSQEKLTKRLRLFKKLGWSHEDLSLAVKNMPNILVMSEERVMRRMKFLTEDIGLEILYIAQRPALMMYSIERRLLPRHCFINVLKRNGLLKINYDFYSTAMISNKKFLDKFVHPYVESIPGLGDAYASSCAGCGVDMLKLLSKDKIMC